MPPTDAKKPALVPHVVVVDVPAAIAFYQKAFSAEEIYRLNHEDGSVVHAEIRIGDAVLMLGEENKTWGALSPKSLHGSPVTLHLTVPDVDKSFAQAVAAGATSDMPVTDMFWGDRYGKIVDPFGHKWSLSTKVRELTPEQVKEAFEKEFGAQAAK